MKKDLGNTYYLGTIETIFTNVYYHYRSALQEKQDFTVISWLRGAMWVCRLSQSCTIE